MRIYAASEADGTITLDVAQAALDMQNVDREGLDKQDRRYLETLIDVFAGGPTGVEAIAATMNLPSDTLSDEVEPFLLREQVRGPHAARPRRDAERSSFGRQRRSGGRSSSRGYTSKTPDVGLQGRRQIAAIELDVDHAQSVTSKMHSISTEMFPGSELVPIALRAPTPASSPNTSAINSEKPLITCG